MRNKIIIFLIALMILPFISAFEGDKISTAWYFAGSTVAVNGKVYTLMIGSSHDKVGFSYENKIEIIDVGSCERITDAGFCVLEIIEESGKTKARIESYDIKTRIKAERSIEYEQLIVGEEVEITVKFTNEGEDDIGLDYIDEFPEGIEITKADKGILIAGNKVEWKGSLDGNQEKELKYSIRAIKKIDLTLVGRLFYDGETFYTNSIHLKADAVLNVDFVWEMQQVPVGYEIGLNVTLRNNENDSIDVKNFTISFPPGLVVSSGIKRISDFNWSGSIGKKSNKTFEFKLLADSSGGYKIKSVAHFEFKEKAQLISRQESKIDVGEPELKIWISFDQGQNKEVVEKNEVEERKSGVFKIDVQKPNPDIIIEDVRLNITIKDINYSKIFYLGLIGLDDYESKNIAMINFTAPNVSRDKKIKLEANATYRTRFGEATKTSEEYELNIIKIRDLKITNDFKGSIESGDDLDVKINVENQRDFAIKNVTICDNNNVPDAPKICKMVNIPSKSNIAVFAYNIKAPRINKTERYQFNTAVNYSDKFENYSYSRQNTLTVEPRTLTLKITKSLEDKDIRVGEPVLVNYSLRNDDEETLKNVTLEFGMSQEFDVIGDATHFIGNIDPKETINLYDIESIRAKVNGTRITVPATRAVYNDFYFGRNFSTDSRTFIVKVNNSDIKGPMMIVNKSVDRKISRQGQNYTVRITVTNKGSATVPITVVDSGFTKTVTPNKNDELVMEYETNSDAVGIQKLSPAKASYSYHDLAYFTVSNQPEIDVKRAAAASTAPVVEEIVQEQQPTDQVPKRLTVMQQIIKFISGLFK